MNIQLPGKRVLVTGGSSGIGEAIVKTLAEAGAKVVVNCHSHLEAAQEIVKQIQQRQGEAFAFQADVSEHEAVARMFEKMDATWGGIDILVNNAGLDGVQAFSWEADLNAWREVLEVNLMGAFYCARQALKRMIPQKSGVILSISSVHEKIAWTGYSAYTASKAGLGMMTQTLAQEAAPHGVRVLALGPGAIKTPINRSVWSDASKLEDLLQKIPLNRLGEPEEIAGMVLVLVSDVASYLTGSTIFVDGGMSDYPDFAHGG
jgi:glucose 1-dehydrogenase